MAKGVPSKVPLVDIGGNKGKFNLLEMVKRSLSSESKSLPTLLLYDEAGLRLFEEITYLDEYYLTSAEIEVLTKHADAMAQYIPAGARLVELGSGNLRKVNLLLEALERAGKHADYYALDVSLSELERTFVEIDTSKFKHVRLQALHGTYDDALAWLAPPDKRARVTCLLTLGSSLGNFFRDEAAQFLADFKSILGPEDLVIAGLDACQDSGRVWSAYNDKQGVTEQFYRNGLRHANELLGHEAFRQDQWSVEGTYNKEHHRHEASYIALSDVVVDGVAFPKGSKLHFENSVKYSSEQSDRLWRDAGLIQRRAFGNGRGDYHVHVLSPSTINFSDAPESYAKQPLPSLGDWRNLWAAWDTVTKAMVPRDELLNKPIQLRNNLIFYLGHIPTFADIHYTKATGDKPTDPIHYAKIFERGIDPDVDDPESCHDHSEIPDTWPPLDEILQYAQCVRNRIVESIESGKASSDRRLARGLWLAYEHESMHLETFLYMLLQSERILPPPGQSAPDFRQLARTASLQREKNQWHHVPEMEVEVGMNDPENDLPPARHFAWDNERPARKVRVHAFESQARPISVGEYAKFLETKNLNGLPASWTVSDKDGRAPSTSAKETNGHEVVNGDGTNSVNDSETDPDQDLASASFVEGKAVRTVYGLVPLKFVLDWPVMASYDELAAFAEWSGGRIPTLEEVKSIYHYVETQKPAPEQIRNRLVPAVNGHLSNDGVEETPPSNSSSTPPVGAGAGADNDHVATTTITTTDTTSTPLSPSRSFINLSGCNVGFKLWHPTATTGEGSRLRGQSDTGGLWEWTSSELMPHEGFKPMDLYPGYTADFFDGKHNVCLGGSWATVPRVAGRKSFVNWYQRNYPYVWCTARVVRDVVVDITAAATTTTTKA